MNNILIIKNLYDKNNIKKYNEFFSTNPDFNFDVVIIKHYWISDEGIRLNLPSNTKLCIVDMNEDIKYLDELKNKFVFPDRCIFKVFQKFLFDEKNYFEIGNYSYFNIGKVLNNYNHNEADITYLKYKYDEKQILKIVLPDNKDDFIKFVDNSPFLRYKKIRDDISFSFW